MTVEGRDTASVREWLMTWGGLVAAADVDGARPLFAASVLGFGTRAEVAEGIDRLVEDQWRQVWPAISGFAFDVDGAVVLVSGDRGQAVIAATWTSVGRRGRATIVLRRPGPDGQWLGVHTHFSLTP